MLGLAGQQRRKLCNLIPINLQKHRVHIFLGIYIFYG